MREKGLVTILLRLCRVSLSCDLQCSRDHTSASLPAVARVASSKLLAVDLLISEPSAKDGMSSTCVVCRSKVLTAVQRRVVTQPTATFTTFS